MLKNVNIKVIDTHLKHLFSVGRPVKGGSIHAMFSDAMKAFDSDGKDRYVSKWLLFGPNSTCSKKTVVIGRDGAIDVYDSED